MENSKKKIRIGDRFRWNSTSIWEVLEFTEEYVVKLICVDSFPNNRRKTPIGAIVSDYNVSILLDDNHENWNYLGNYSKVNNFEQLYNLFNE